MKRTIKILMTAIMLMATSAASAENITVSQAKDAAAYYMQCYTNLTRLTADQLTLVRQWNNSEMGIPSMYLLTAPERGWIIMAATTVIDPVVAYAAVLKAGGTLLLSGFYEADEAALVARAEELGMILKNRKNRDGWSALELTLNS